MFKVSENSCPILTQLDQYLVPSSVHLLIQSVESSIAQFQISFSSLFIYKVTNAN